MTLKNSTQKNSTHTHTHTHRGTEEEIESSSSVVILDLGFVRHRETQRERERDTHTHTHTLVGRRSLNFQVGRSLPQLCWGVLGMERGGAGKKGERDLMVEETRSRTFVLVS